MSKNLIYGLFFTIFTVLFYLLYKSWKTDRKNKDDGSVSFKIITLGDTIKYKILIGLLIFISIFFLTKSYI